MTPQVLRFVQATVAQNEILEPVVDFGGLMAVEQEEEFGNVIKRLFAGKDFKIFDLRPGADLIGDIHDTQIPPQSIGTALLLETLEHLAWPQRAINEIYRVLRPGGLFMVSTLMCWEEHRCPKDYWRFLPDGIEHLFRTAGFVELLVTTNAPASEPSSIFAIARRPV